MMSSFDVADVYLVLWGVVFAFCTPNELSRATGNEKRLNGEEARKRKKEHKKRNRKIERSKTSREMEKEKANKKKGLIIANHNAKEKIAVGIHRLISQIWKAIVWIHLCQHCGYAA